MDKNFVYVAGEVFDSHIDAGEPAWNWECDYLGVKINPPARADGARRRAAATVVAHRPRGYAVTSARTLGATAADWP